MLHRGQLITDHNYALLDNVDDNPEEIPQIPDDTEVCWFFISISELIVCNILLQVITMPILLFREIHHRPVGTELG